MKNIWIEKKKNILIMLFFFIIMMVVSGFTSMAVRAEGNTWNTAPADGIYRISTVDDLTAFREMINTEMGNTGGKPFIDKTVVLENDIEIATPLTCSKNITSCTFSGAFDGKGHTIKGFNDTTYGLFGSIGETGTVKNLNIVADVNTNTASLKYGVYAYRNNGLISSCSVTGDVSSSGAGSSVGGMIYELQAKGRIENCYSRVKISLTMTGANTNASGLINISNSAALNCVNNCYVMSEKIEAGKNIFAVAQAKKDGVVTNCYYSVANNPTFSTNNKGITKTSDELKLQTTYTNWDFYNVWKINSSENGGYPTLQFGSPKTVAEVTGFIDGLKTANELTLDDQFTVSYVRKAVSALSEQDRQSVNNLSKLTEAESRISVLANAKTKADQVTALINVIPVDNEITLEHRSQIETAKSELTSATSDADVLSFITEDTKNKLSAAEAKLNAITSNSNTWESSNKTSISTAEDLNAFRSSITAANTYSGKTIVLNNDITINETQVWASLNAQGLFQGSFDGKGHMIKGFNDPKNGLFYNIDKSGSVLNLNLELAINNTTVDLGGITNILSGTISSCYVSGTVNSTMDVAGIVSYSYPNSSINNCVCGANLSTTGEDASGIAAMIQGQVNNSYVIGTLAGKNIYAIGKTATSGIGGATSCYYLNTIYENKTKPASNNPGDEKNSEALKTAETYTNWDFTSVWAIDANKNDGYPYLLQAATSTEKKTINLKAVVTIEDKEITAENVANLPDDFLDAKYTIKLVSADGSVGEDALSQYEVKLEPIGSTASVKFNGLESTEGIDFTEQFKTALSSSKYKFTYKTNDKYNFEFFAETGFPLATPECNKPKFKYYNNTAVPDKEKIIQATETRIQESLAHYLPANVSGHDAVFGAGNNQYGSWLIFTSARAGYTPHAGFFDECYQAFAEKYTASKKVTGEGKPLNEGFDTNEVAKDALAITAMGYDARNVAGYNLIEMMTNGKNPSDGYFAGQASSFAIDSYDYLPGTQQAYAVELAKKALAGASTGNDPLIDMYIMGSQPLAAYYDPNAQEGTDLYYVKQAMETVFIPYFSRLQGYTGVFYSGISYNNPWSNAQVYIMLGMADADIFQTTFIKNGFSMLDSLASVSQSYGADQGQIARGYEAVVRAYRNENQIFDCTDVLNSTVRVNNAIAALPATDTIIDDATKTAAQEKLTAVDTLLSSLTLSDTQKNSIDKTKYNAVKARVEGKDAQSVTALIDALPSAETIALSNKPAVVAARSAYSNLSSDEQKKVTNFSKLEAAEAKIKALEDAGSASNDQAAADAVIAKINALGTITSYDQKAAVEAARSAYNGLTDSQKMLVSADTKTLLKNAEAAIEALKPAAGSITIDVERFTIGQGFYVEPVTLPIKEGETARQAIEELLGAENLIGEVGYLRAVTGADTGTAAIPDYIVSELKGDDSTKANAYSQKYSGTTLGEFDYSKYSGWYFLVNNQAPNVGMDAYTLKNGDVMRLAFTYWGYGSDLTGLEYGTNKVLVSIANKDSLLKAIAAVSGNSAYLQDAAIKTAYDAARTTVQDMTASQKATSDAATALDKAIADYKPSIPTDPGDDAKIAKAVTDQIAALPAVEQLALTDKAAVAAARTAYDGLTETQKYLVTNLGALTAAEAKIAELEKATPPAKDEATGIEMVGLPAGVGLKVETETDDAGKIDEAEKAAATAGIKDAKVISLYRIKPDMSEADLAAFNDDPDSFVTLTIPLGDDQQGYTDYRIYHKKTDGTVE
ncbi:DUF4430 domain-containing protein, partial [Acetobacterium bakii]